MKIKKVIIIVTVMALCWLVTAGMLSATLVQNYSLQEGASKLDIYLQQLDAGEITCCEFAEAVRDRREIEEEIERLGGKK